MLSATYLAIPWPPKSARPKQAEVMLRKDAKGKRESKSEVRTGGPEIEARLVNPITASRWRRRPPIVELEHMPGHAARNLMPPVQDALMVQDQGAGGAAAHDAILVRSRLRAAHEPQVRPWHDGAAGAMLFRLARRKARQIEKEDTVLHSTSSSKSGRFHWIRPGPLALRSSRMPPSGPWSGGCMLCSRFL